MAESATIGAGGLACAGGPLFGGSTWPIAWGAGFLEIPVSVARGAFVDWRRERNLSPISETELDAPVAEQLARLAPLESPYSRRLLVATGNGWTACFDNSLLGGDYASWVAYLSDRLDCRAVLAHHIPPAQYSYPSTMFELLGPDGEQPLRYVRSVAAGIYDSGRWSFEDHGPVQAFEQPERYTARLKRERLTRELLLEYLLAFGLRADEPDFFGAGVLLQELDRAPNQRVLELDEARREYAER